MIRNSWGQKIEVGTFVYRGARLGNSSDYKAGVVESIKDGKPRVRWLYRSNGRWIKIDGERILVPYVYEVGRASLGVPPLESIVVADFDLERLERLAAIHKEFPKDIEFTDMEDYYNFLDNYIP